METLYQNTKVIKKLKEHYQPYISLLTKPSGSKFFLLLLGMIAMQFTTSICFLYKWFLSDLCGLSLNSYYHLLTYANIPLDAFFKITVKKAASLIPEELKGLPILLIIDDTLQAKFGTHFACYQNMFDHAKHNGSQYLKGHCFVALMVSVPVFVNDGVAYLSIPVGFRLRRGGENKLKIASAMVDFAMESLCGYPSVILLCDSWYPKGSVRKTVAKHKNLGLIANARIDTRMFDLPPPRTGKRGRPADKGKELDKYADFRFIRAGDYYIAVKHVLTNLFKTPVYATVTTPDPANHKAYRLFISTLTPDALKKQFNGYEKKFSGDLKGQVLWLLPLFLYSYRWPIEVLFYEMKTFWSFGRYMLRSKNGIENFINMMTLCYSGMKIIPYCDPLYSPMRNESAQSVKNIFGNAIYCELFLWKFASKHENSINSYAGFDQFAGDDLFFDRRIVS